MANFWWATHDGVSHESLSLGDKCEWTLWSSSSKHSAASPKQPSGKRRLANGPLARALRRGSGQSAGSELVCSCVNKFWKEKEKKVSDTVKVSARQSYNNSIYAWTHLYSGFVKVSPRIEDVVWTIGTLQQREFLRFTCTFDCVRIERLGLLRRLFPLVTELDHLQLCLTPISLIKLRLARCFFLCFWIFTRSIVS